MRNINEMLREYLSPFRMKIIENLYIDHYLDPTQRCTVCNEYNYLYYIKFQNMLSMDEDMALYLPLSLNINDRVQFHTRYNTGFSFIDG